MKTPYSAATRFVVLGNAATTILISLNNPMSQHGQALIEAGPTGKLAFVVITAFIVVGFLDILINDVFPDTVDWKWSHKYRHLGFVLLGAGQLGWYLEAYNSEHADPVLLRYIWDMGCSFALAVAGMYQHVKTTRAEIIQVQQRRKQMLAHFGAD